MALIFRHAEQEHTLRSVDDHPGIIGSGLVMRDGEPWWGFTVDQSMMPTDQEIAAIVVAERIRAAQGLNAAAVGKVIVDDASAQAQIPIELADAVAACEGQLELVDLLLIAQSLIPSACGVYVPSFAFEAIRDAAVWACEARDVIHARLRELGA